MKIIALFKKEIRECFPAILLAATTILLIGMVALRAYSRFQAGRHDQWHNGPGVHIAIHRLVYRHPVTEMGLLVFFVALLLGVALAFRQFWMPGFAGTWAFTLHRSTKRQTVLAAKLAVGAICLALGVGLAWTLLYMWSPRLTDVAYPARLRVLAEGWVFILMGYLVYCGTTLMGLIRARWYGTKVFGLAFAVFIMVLALTRTTMAGCLTMAAVGLAILLVQIVYAFETREF